VGKHWEQFGKKSLEIIGTNLGKNLGKNVDTLKDNRARGQK
jgi:hypothetical protein